MRPFRDPRSRILLYFVAGIAVPSGLLGYLALRGIQNDRALVERERRNELQRLMVQVQSTISQRLAGLTSSFSTSAPRTSIEGRAVIQKNPLIDAVFILAPDSTVRLIAARGLRFARPRIPERRVSDLGSRWKSEFQGAEGREHRSADLAGALVAYRRALALATDHQSQGETMNAIARVQRKLRFFTDAARTYEKIRTDLGDVPVGGGMLLGPAVGLERGAVLLEAGDTATATRVLLQHYAEVLGGRWALPPSQFDFVTTGLSELLAPLQVGDTLKALEKAEAVHREHATGLLALEEALERTLQSSRGASGVAVTAGAKTFHVVLLDRTGGANEVRAGFSFDLLALATAALEEVLGPSRPLRAGWVLKSPSGDTLRPVTDPPLPESPRITGPLASYSPWILELGIPATGTPGSFLTSRRAVYFYAFVLLASILLFGLILTIRTVGRELELARLKSDFVSTVSHEFRSPLTTIRHLAEMLIAGRILSEERRQRYYEVLQEQSERLALLVDNVLDLTRLEEGKRPLALEPVPLSALIEQSVAAAQHRFAHQGFQIRVERDGPLPVVHIDPTAIQQALGNLLDNAVKYSGPAREIVVSGFAGEGRAGVRVQDFGLGIEPPDLGRVFERFYRGGDPLTRAVKGTGLGLALVKEIVEAHGGTVGVRSEPGRGSTFSLQLPVPNRELPPAEPSGL